MIRGHREGDIEKGLEGRGQREGDSEKGSVRRAQ
jgi:hypothetical protein